MEEFVEFCFILSKHKQEKEITSKLNKTQQLPTKKRDELSLFAVLLIIC